MAADNDLAAQVDRLKRRVIELEEALAAAYVKRDYKASVAAGFIEELDDFSTRTSTKRGA